MTPAAPFRQIDADRLFKAAHRAGYSRAKFVSYPDGRIEITAEDDGRATVSVAAIAVDHDALINSRLDALGED